MTAQTGDLYEYPGARDMRCPFDPPAELERRLQEEPVSKVQSWGDLEAWLITRYDDVKFAFTSPAFSADPGNPGYPEKSAAYAATVGSDRSLRTLDDPEHAQQKRMVMDDFTVKRVEQLRPRIQQRVDELIDDMLEAGPGADIVTDLAFPVPTMVICELLGVPYEDREFFAGRSEISFSSAVTLEEAQQAGEDLKQYLDKLVGIKDEDPQDDLISRLVVRQMRQGILSRREVVEISRLMLLAGHETTANSIVLSVLALLQNPEQLRLLKESDDHAVVVNAVDELMRYLSPTHTGRRRACVADVTVGDQEIKAGEGIIVANNLADRDESVFPNADVLDVTRTNAKDNLAFGWGTHQCPGQYLSRVELQVVHGTLWQRIPSLRLAIPFEEIRFKEEGSVYGAHELPVTWDA